ncbi:MAG TPA: alanine dehydrogenase [Flavobacteriales bacterium]|nr:alanine dehydrogenase [Flavobacteriales bacterium]HIO68826.1 alanine dehydrogenase [Flavobacteriales bacterium]
MKARKSSILSASVMSGLMPQEETLEVGKKKSSLFIGIPKETSLQENRVALVPQAVVLLVNNGHKVVIERGAGKGANFADNDYSEAGAEIVNGIKEVFEADIVMKVEPLAPGEIDLLKPKQTVFSALQMAIHPKNYIKKLIAKKVHAIAFDNIQDSHGKFPVIQSMGEIAGNTSILIAAELLSNVNGGKGFMLGGVAGVPATEVVILGAGTVGEFAARSAIGLGATVKIFDDSLYKLRRLQNDLSMRVFTSILQPDVLHAELKTADVVIGAIRAPDKQTPCIVTEEMIQAMKPGSVVVDISIDQGGCFETSKITDHNKPTFIKHDVVHYCVPNITSRVARTASCALSNIFADILLEIGDYGGVDGMLKANKGVRNGVYIYNGILTNKMLGEHLGISYKDIDLLMAAW